MRKLIFLFVLMVASVATMAAKTNQQANYITLHGNIGPYEVTFNFDNNYNGYYFYNDRPKTHFKLKCVKNKSVQSLDEPGGKMDEVVIKEYTPKGKNSGTFDGTFQYTMNMWVFYTGTFTNTTTGEKFDFELQTRLVE